MATKKHPNYEDMSLEELNAAAAEHYAAIRELAGGDLESELKAAEHRAHLRIINPLRTDKGVTAELARSVMARRMRGMSDRQWDELRQVINAPDAIAETTVHEPGAEQA